MDSKTYSFGIIGPGRIAAKMAAAISLLPEAKLTAVASRDFDRAHTFAQSFSCEHVYGTYEALAADKSVDIVYIATPHSFHAEQAILCLNHGKAILCEKPLALSAGQVTQMITAAKANNCFLMEAMWTRFLPVMQKVLENIARIGEIKYVRADFGFNAPFDPNSRLFNPTLGGGALLDVGIYPIFLATQLLGIPEKITATGTLSEQNIDLNSQALLEYASGASANISASLTAETGTTAEIGGTLGTIRIPAPWYKNHQFDLEVNGVKEKISTTSLFNGFEFELMETLRCLDEGLIESPFMSHAFSLQMATVMDEIRKQLNIKYPGE